MANYTATTDMTLETAISNGSMTNGQNLTINAGAVVTVDQAPSILVGQVSINDGEYIFDGANSTNPVVYVGEESEEINVNGAGVLRSSLGWWEFPTTGDGTADQTFDCSTYYTGAIINADVFSGVWVETGRRINYDGGTGIAPLVGDWVFSVADRDVHGRIEAVSGDGVTGYLVVTFLTGALADNEAIELHTIQDNRGPDYVKSWNALADGVDVLETGVFQGFGNCFQNNNDYLPVMGSGMAGFAFSQNWQSNTLTFGDGTNGSVVPNGARLRVPMVHIATGTIASVGTNIPTWPTSIAAKHELETVNGGDCYLDGVSLGSAHFEDNLGNDFQSSYCAANHAFGVYGALQRTSYDNCIFVAAIVDDSRSASRSVPAVVDMVQGSDVTDCLSIHMNDTGETTTLGGQTSIGVNITRVIAIGNGTLNEFEMLRIAGLTVYDAVSIGTQIVLNTCTNGTIQLLKTQKNITGGVSGPDQVIIQSVSSNIKLTGWEVLQNSRPNDSLVVVADSSDIEVRCFHFIDDKFDNEALGGTEGEEFVFVGGLSSDVTVSRCWIDRGNPNEFAVVTAGTSKNVTLQNCSGEYNGELEPDGINTIFRGVHGGSGSLGASTGLETDFPGTAGAMMGDAFESTTRGYIYYRNCPGTAEYPQTILSGNPRFTKDGDVDVVPGDQWEVDMGYVSLGHTGFTGVVTTTRNGAAVGEGVDNWTGVDIDFQYDVGAGYNGTWLDLRTASNLTDITDTVDGVQLKLRFTANTTQTNGQALTIHTTTTIQSQIDNYHPLDQQLTTLTVNAVTAGGVPIEGARVRVTRVAGGSLVMTGLTDSNGVLTDTAYLYTTDEDFIGYARKSSFAPFYKTGTLSGTMTTNGLTMTAVMVLDQ